MWESVASAGWCWRGFTADFKGMTTTNIFTADELSKQLWFERQLTAFHSSGFFSSSKIKPTWKFVESWLISWLLVPFNRHWHWRDWKTINIDFRITLTSWLLNMSSTRELVAKKMENAHTCSTPATTVHTSAGAARVCSGRLASRSPGPNVSEAAASEQVRSLKYFF